MWWKILLLGLAVSSAVGAMANVPVLENISVTPEVEVEEGETAILNCSVHSVPTADLLWIQDGVILRHVRSNWASLVLQNASRFHLKLFTCQATNPHFVFKFLRSATLIRKKGTYEVVAKPHLAPRDLPVLHRPFRLDCTVFDLPFHFVVERLSYTWYKDHRVIEGQSKSTLLIPSLSKEDGGIYSCTATYGHVMSTSPQSNDYTVLVLVPPVVHMEPRSPNNTITWAAGKTLTLTCKVTEALPGVPSAGYSWSHLPSPQGQLRPLEARESTLTLGPVTEEDSGQYFCQARSDPDFQGELPPGKASVTVDVVYLKDINLISDLVVNEGERVVLTCETNCKPKANLVWSVGGREVRHVTANVDHYVVERAACSDNKTYTCRASNVAVSGLEKTASTRLLVNCSQRDENDVLLMANTTTSMQMGVPGDAIKIAVPIVVIAILVSAGLGVVFWRKKLCFDRSVKKTPEDRNVTAPLQENQEA